jgi:DNA-binding MarR family transcriptional regulator
MTATGRPGDGTTAQLPLDGFVPATGEALVAESPGSSVTSERPRPAAGQVPPGGGGTSVSGLGVLLAQLGASSSRRFAARVAELGLGTADAAVLRLVAYAPGLSQREVADRLGLQPSRLVALVDALEGRGLVERARSHADRRLYELRLAPGGMAVYERLARVIAEHDDDMGGRLSPEDRAVLVGLLQRVAADAGLASGPELSYRLA